MWSHINELCCIVLFRFVLCHVPVLILFDCFCFSFVRLFILCTCAELICHQTLQSAPKCVKDWRVLLPKHDLTTLPTVSVPLLALRYWPKVKWDHGRPKRRGKGKTFSGLTGTGLSDLTLNSYDGNLWQAVESFRT